MATNNPLKYRSLGGLVDAMQQEQQDAILAAQERRRQLLEQQYAALLADQEAAQPVATAPQAAPAQEQPAGKIPSLLERVARSSFATQFLPTQKNVEGKPLSVSQFYALPFEEREKVGKAFIDARAEQRNWDAKQRERATKEFEEVIYADSGGKAPSIGGRLVGDIWDRAAASLRGFATGAAAAGLSNLGKKVTDLSNRGVPAAASLREFAEFAERKAQGVREYEKAEQAADLQRYEPATLDVLRRRQFRERQREAAPEQGAVTDKAAGFLGDLFRAPGATVGEIAGGTAPSLLAARLTRGRSLGVRGMGFGLVGGASALNVNEATYQAALKAGMSPEDARAAASLPTAVAGQLVAGVAEGFGVRYGLEGLLRAGAGGALRRTGTAAAVEGLEGAAASAPAQVSENVALGRPVMDDVAGAALEGAVQESVGGAVLSPVVNMLAGQPAAVPVEPPMDPAASPVDTAPVGGMPGPDGAAAPVAAAQDTAASAAEATITVPVQREVPVPDSFDAPSQLTPFVDIDATNPAIAENLETTLSGLFARPQPVTAKELADLGVVLKPTVEIVNEQRPAAPAPPTIVIDDTPSTDPNSLRNPEVAQRIIDNLDAARAAGELPAAATSGVYNSNPLARRDTTGVPDTPVSPELAQAIQSPYGVAATSAVEYLTRTASTPTQRKMAGFLLEKLKKAEYLLGTPIPIVSQQGLTVTDKNGVTSRASGVFQLSPDAKQARVVLDQEAGLAEEVLLHEVAHAAAEAHMQATPERLSPPQRAARDDIVALHQYALGQGMLDTFEIPDASEFVSEALTNPRMQAVMKATPYNQKLSVWGKFTEALRGLLGFDKLKVPDNMFEATLTAVDALTRTGVEFTPDMMQRPAGQRVPTTEAKTPFVAGQPMRLYRGSNTVESTAPRVADGLLGPGRYLTGDLNAARGYGQNVSAYTVTLSNPIVVDIGTIPNEDPAAIVGDIANQLYQSTGWFMTKGAARKWAREEVENFSGIGDPDFTEMLRDGGFDGVVLLRDGQVVEANVPFGPLDSPSIVEHTSEQQSLGGGTVAARQRREAPPLPPEMEQQALLEKQAKEAQKAAQDDIVDFLEARFETDPKDVFRGSAFLDRTTGLWKAKFMWDNGKVYENIAPLRTRSQAEEFLNRFRPLDANGQPTGSTRSVVVRGEKNSGRVANYEGVMRVQDALRPGSREFYDRAVAIGLPKDLAHRMAKWKDGFTRWQFSRLSALEAVRDDRPGSLTERAVLRRAQAAAQAQFTGVGERTFKDRIDALYSTIRSAQQANAGLSADMTDLYMYAASASQRNAIKAKSVTTDAFGRPRAGGKDFSKFAYWARPDGSITAPNMLGAKKVEGEGAATRYMEQFAKQFPSAMPAMKQALDELRDVNKFAIGLQLENGVISPEKAAQLAEQDLYLPMQQISGRPSGTVGTAEGRRTMAQSPLAQLKGVLAARIDHAAYKGMIKDMAEALQRHPNPAVASLNSYDVKVDTRERDTDEDDDTADVKRLVARDWLNQNSVKVWVGDRQIKMTINDENLLRALRPTDRGEVQNGVLAAAAAATQMTSAFLTATPSFWLKAIGWDLAQVALTTQGSFSRPDMPMDTLEAYKQTLGTYKRTIPSLADSVRTVMKRDAKDPLRRFYNVSGGGIVFGEQFKMRDAMLDVGIGTNMNRLTRAAQAVPSIVTAPGHVLSDAVRYAAFRAFIENKNGGPFRSEAEILSFAQANPDVVQAAIAGSKAVLGNYEDIGQQMLMRSVVPFYNAAAVGVGQNLKKALGTRQGLTTMGAIAAVAFMTAMSEMGDEEDIDADGFSKFLRRQSSWEGLQIGGATIPLPHEMRLALVAGYNMAAGAAYALGGANPVDVPNLTKRSINAVLQGAMLPVPGVEMGDKEFWAAFGPLGTLMQLHTTENDAFGRERVHDSADKAWKSQLQPYYMNPRASDTEAGVQASKFLWENGGWNVSPAAADMWFSQFAGGHMGLFREVGKAEAEGRTATDAFGQWILKGYAQSEDNMFAAQDRWKAEQNAMATASSPLQDAFITHNKSVKKATDGIGKLYMQMGAARREGNVELYRQLQEEIKTRGGSVDQLRREWYQMTGNQNRDLLRP